jgi:hypothetical protein
MSETTCAIWNTPAEQLEKAGDFVVLDSPRAGGKYWISGTAIGQIGSLTDNAKRLLTTWLCEQRRAGFQVPKVQSGVVELVKARKPLPIMVRVTAALRTFGDQIVQLGDQIIFSGPDDTNTLRFLAETESRNVNEFTEVLRMLNQIGHLEGEFLVNSGGRFRPTAAGWTEIDKLRQPRVDSSQGFVAMWFHESTEEAYLNGIAPALRMTGFAPIRIDKKEHNNKINDEIVAEIRRSRFLVADFTCEPNTVRGGVYYEAGFAQGLGIPVIWMCKDTSISDLHFDTRQYAHIIWKTPADLLTQLKNRIGATVGDGPLPSLGWVG